jgi:hypothetical protein
LTTIKQPQVAAQLVAQDRDYFVATWHRTVLTVFRGAPTVEQVTKITGVCKKLLANSQGDTTYLSVIERTSPAPTEPVRRELAHWSRDVVTQMASAVIVPEGGGFRSAMVRGVGIALTALIPHKVPFRFPGTVEEAAQLLARFIPESAGGAAELLLAVAEARARWAQGY